MHTTAFIPSSPLPAFRSCAENVSSSVAARVASSCAADAPLYNSNRSVFHGSRSISYSRSGSRDFYSKKVVFVSNSSHRTLVPFDMTARMSYQNGPLPNEPLADGTSTDRAVLLEAAPRSVSRRAVLSALAATVLSGAALPFAANAKAPATPTEEQEAEAAALFNQMLEYQDEVKFDEALKIASKIEKEYANTAVGPITIKMKLGIEAVGRQVGPVILSKWIQGEDTWKGWAEDAKKNAKAGQSPTGATLVVFWEEWCPHCREHIPEVENVYERLSGSGLRVIALTAVTKPATEDSVRKFVEEKQLSFPVAIEDGRLSKRFGVAGVPAAAIVKAGIIEWRGHPRAVTDDLLSHFITI